MGGDTMSGIRELDPAETHLAYTTLLELRPHLPSLEAFVARVNTVQRSESYRLIGSFIEGTSEPVAVAGFRTLHILAWGHVLYVDDLITQEAHRNAGHADRLIQWLIGEAQRLGCDQFHLDSGVQRHVAHRFYFAHGMRISAYHFQRDFA
ncbi:MAG: GNAT family N-acetyltransferase [Ktedonobacterales bacterium]